jgi:hypothetical protein
MFKVQNETSVDNISVQNIPPGGATVTVGGVSLDPAPFVSLSIEQYRVGDLIIGGSLIVSLNGTVYTTDGGFSDIAGKLKSKFKDIGQKGDCVSININCSGSILVNGYGTVRSVNIEEGPEPSWTQVAAYSVELEMYENESELVVKPNAKATSYVTSNEIIKDISESITLNIDNDAFSSDSIPGGNKAGRAHAKYSFNISATGGGVGCDASVSRKTGLEAAEEVLKRRLSALESGSISNGLSTSNSLISALGSYHAGPKYMHVRSLDADPINGTITVNGDLIIRPTGTPYPQAFIDISVDSRAETAQVGRNVTVSGTVEGLYTTSFSDLITNGQFHPSSTNRISNAESAYSSLSGSFIGLATMYLSGVLTDTGDCTDGGLLGICPSYVPPQECGLRLVNKSETRNFGQGTIGFSFEYSTAQNCSIPGATKVETEVTHNYPTDVFAEFTIPFRGEPLLQDLGTTTKETVAVNVTATVENPGCDVRDMSGVIGCAVGIANSLASSEGASGWYLTQSSITKNNTGTLRVSKEWTKPHNC